MSPRQIFVINSQEELKKIFYKEETVPEIDFSTHTLIIGYHPFGGTTGDKYPTSLKKQELYKTETGYTLFLYTTYDISW